MPVAFRQGCWRFGAADGASRAGQVTSMLLSPTMVPSCRIVWNLNTLTCPCQSSSGVEAKKDAAKRWSSGCWSRLLCWSDQRSRRCGWSSCVFRLDGDGVYRSDGTHYLVLPTLCSIEINALIFVRRWHFQHSRQLRVLANLSAPAAFL